MAGSILQETVYYCIKLSEQQIFSCSTLKNNNNNINLTVRKPHLEEDLPSTVSIAKRTPLPLLPSALRKPTSSSPAVIPVKGIPTFKQVQLYKTYRRLLPTEYQDITCPKPSMESLKLEEEDPKRR
jgi:hypothetical protein